MLTETLTPKRGPKPQGFVDMKVAVTPEQNAMLEQIAAATGVSKAALVRDALAQYGEVLGFMPEGTAANLTPTRTRRRGSSASDRKEHQ